MKKLTIIYRENNLFESYIPEIIKHLSKNLEIKKIIYPPSTTEGEISTDLQIKLQDIKDSHILMDETCTCLVGNQDYKFPKLDDYFQEELCRFYELGIENYGDYHTLFNLLLKKLLGREKPKKIILVIDHLADHTTKECEEILKKLGYPNVHWYDIFNNIEKGSTIEKLIIEYKKERNKAMGKFVLSDSRFIRNDIGEYLNSEFITKEKYSDVGETEKNDENNLIIADRHCKTEIKSIGYEKNVVWPYKSKFFILPLTSMADHLVAMGLIKKECDTKSISEKILKKIV